MKRLTLLPLTAAVSFAQANPAATAPEAPLAPVAASLLQNNPAAPASIDRVLLVPHGSADQKAASFVWADANGSQAYVLWDKVFVAATNLANPDTTAFAAPTLVSAGYMTSKFGAGLSLGYAKSTHDAVNTTVTKTSYAMSQTKLFGSFLMGGKDLYGSLAWVGSPKATVSANNPPVSSDIKTVSRFDSLSLNVGLRHGPAAGQQGLGWNLALTLGQNYARPAGSDPETQAIVKLLAQVGYAHVVDGIAFYPGADLFVNHTNGKGNVDSTLTSNSNIYADNVTEYGIAPSATIIVPLFEHWTLQGGAKCALYSSIEDNVAGKKSNIFSYDLLTSTSGNFGLRYARDRWAAQAGVSNGFLNRGPYFVSGAGGDLFYSLGFTVNLK